MAKQGELPPIWETLELDLELLEKMVAGGDGDAEVVRPLSMNEMLMINSATATSVGTVVKKGKVSKIALRLQFVLKLAVELHFLEELVQDGALLVMEQFWGEIVWTAS